MIDTLATSQAFTKAGIETTHAEAITAAVHQAADQGDHVTRDELRVELAALEVRLVKWIAGIVLAVAGIQTAAIIAVLRLLGQ